jgi:hypothetical protein
MPRVRSLIDPAAEVAGLAPVARRIRRAHQALDDRRLVEQWPAAPLVPARPGRYLLVQVYADAGRDCGQAIVYGDTPADLLRDTAHQVGDGWIPYELLDLDTDHQWRIDMQPTIRRAPRPAEQIAHATAELAALADTCGYHPEKDCGIDALIDYKDAVEDRLHAAIAAGWAA